MRLTELTIQNVRAIEDINIRFTGIADVIVGPNGVGKTTILEAIRVAKAILAPRTGDEAQQVLMSLGVISPHLPQQVNMSALVRDAKLPVVISCRYQLADTEVGEIDSLTGQVANSLVRARLGTAAQDRLALVQYMSSQQGQNALSAALSEVTASLASIKNTKLCILQLSIDPQTQNFIGADQSSQFLFGALEGRLPPHLALFSYFPADRAMPTSDVNIQVGAPDVVSQLVSHNSQPQTKYQRLKTTVVNSYLMKGDKPDETLEDFRKIFRNLMKDREIVGLKISNFGFVSVQIKDLITNQVFDIDSMSSGEKGLILMFLLIARNIANGGVILIDEPELHLNPAVCKLLLPFLVEQYLKPQNIQAIICSHSPEVLGAAFDRGDCGLHHLQSEKIISPILPDDKKEVFDALRRLGTTASDVLFSSGSVFVEGDDDVDILEAGFSKTLNRYNVKKLQGRGNVEREIRTLQEAETRGEVDTLKCFVFDLDNAPTQLRSTGFVRVSQWKRRCIENYLINEKVIYDLLRDDGISKDKIEKRGEAAAILREIALTQLNDVVAKTVYTKTEYVNLGPPGSRDLLGKSFNESAAFLFDKIEMLQGQVVGLKRPEWCSQFVSACETEVAALRPKWESEWVALCDGKRFFRDVHARFGVKVSPVKLKVRIMERLERDGAEEWVLVDSFLKDALKP